MPRPLRSAKAADDLPDLRDVIGGVNAMLDALLAAAMPVLTCALVGKEQPARLEERADERRAR